MAQLSFVFQDVYLLEGTIADNIRIARPDATAEQIAEVVRLARVDEIVDRVADGIDTRVGEGGVALSGGERQRVSIARALLKDAPIVLLDEATAAIDPENEALLHDALRVLTADRREIDTPDSSGQPMTEPTSVELGTVQETLLIPLYGRAILTPRRQRADRRP